MKKSFLRLSFFMLLFNEAIGQDNLPPAYELKSDTGVYLTIDDSYWQVLDDKNESWNVDQVKQPPISDNFYANYSKVKGIDYRIHVYWFRYRLKNTTNKSIEIVLLNIAQADQTDFYLFDDATRSFHFTTGVLCPNKKKDGLKKINGVPVLIDPGKELMVYSRMANNYYVNKPKYLSVSIGFAKQVIQEEYIDGEDRFSFRYLNAIFTGILLFACIFNLFFYSISRDPVYLFYALFLFYFSFEPDFLSPVIFPDRPFILQTMEYQVWTLGIFLFVHFIRYFLKTFDRFPKWDIALKSIAIVHPAVAILTFLIEPYLLGIWSGVLPEVTFFLFVVGLFMILITFLKCLRSSIQFSRVLLVAAIPASTFWAFGFGLTFLFSILNEKFAVEPPAFMNWLNSWLETINLSLVIWFVISFSWALVLQFVQLRKENAQQALDKERLAKEGEIERSRLMEQQKTELENTVEERTAELKHSLESLKSTQAQLIQSEKMASLVDLTAGIAHEIQNPLNFVNNFSELNAELFDDLEQEADKGNLDEVRSIAKGIKENQQKINHHGKRADAIVKGMLQHSRSTSGAKEPTDINALVDEYLRLAYHGFRAKDKSFSAKMKTDFDETIGAINVIRQDIGRVILNLISNAFYAVNEKKRQTEDGLPRQVSYEPTVSVSTKKIGDKIEIRVVDNGNGIPPDVLDKIFQPFFTTKPVGQGTGLGLSLAYDIVKAHGGELRVESPPPLGSSEHEGVGSAFIIQLQL